jgi:hypothetical protein
MEANMSATMDTSIETIGIRMLHEGYGEGAWHGPDLKAALADVSEETAFARPAPGRHNIAEVALHHAYCAHNVRAKLAGVAAEPFVVEGDDWFELPTPSTMRWSRVLEVVAREQEQLAACVSAIGEGGGRSPLTERERFDLVLGITCHAVYHAGQIQLLKRLASS